MLRSLSDEVRYAHQRAADLANKAKQATNEAVRADFLSMERNWLKLARSYDFSERLGGFVNHLAAQKATTLRARIPVVTCADCATPMRLQSLVPHPKYNNLDQHTYECTCGHQTVVSVARISD